MSDFDELLGQYDRSWQDEEAAANLKAMRPPPRERPDETYRGVVAPFRETTSGQHEWALPRMIQGPIDAARTLASGLYESPFVGPMVRPSTMPEHVSNQMAESAGDVAGAALMGTTIPSALAGMPRNQLNAFMTPEQMGRLQKAGRIQPGQRGSQEALAAAEAEWAKGNLDTWADFGWAHKSAFGPEGQTPIAWHNTRDFEMWPDIREAFEARYSPDSGRGVSTVPGTKLQDVFAGTGLDDILTAQPSLADVPIRVGFEPDYPKGYAGFDPDSKGYLWGPTKLEAMAGDAPVMIETMVHELMGHGVPMAGGALKIHQNKTLGSPVSGTAAESRMQALTDEARAKMIAARLAGDNEAWNAYKMATSDLDELTYGVPAMAGYYASPHERMAREAMMRHFDPELDMIPPGRVDVYAPEAWPGGADGSEYASVLGVPLRDFAPPGSPFAKKD